MVAVALLLVSGFTLANTAAEHGTVLNVEKSAADQARIRAGVCKYLYADADLAYARALTLQEAFEKTKPTVKTSGHGSVSSIFFPSIALSGQLNILQDHINFNARRLNALGCPMRS